MTTQQTAKTQYITTNGIQLAYRQLGPHGKIPLVLLMHFRGTMDDWDPALINRLARTRPVLLLDNAGVGHSGGSIPLTFAGWADHVIALLGALHIPRADLLGFSMGGMAAQMIALNAPGLVRKLILAGTRASDGPNTVHPSDTKPFVNLVSAATPAELEAAHAAALYYTDEVGRSAARASWERIHERKGDADDARSDAVSVEDGKRQVAAVEAWSVIGNPSNSYHRLGELKMPVFVANGDNDTLVPSVNSWELMERIEDATLHIYPHAGHGFLFQYAELFAKHVDEFLGDSA